MRLMVNKAFACCYFLVLLAAFSSCSLEKRTQVKNYPPNKPFVFNNKIVLNGNISKDEKNRLLLDLDNYWDDSLKVREVQQFFGLRYVIRNPATYDSINISRSVNFMNAYLNSQGYYYAVFNDTVKVDTVKDQERVKVTMEIHLGKNITIDSVSYDLSDTTLQQLTKSEEKNTVLKKGLPYTKTAISNELDRLILLYRQNGYYKFTREEIFAYVDSTDKRLLQLTLDPFQQAQLVAEAARNRQNNPKWDISIEKKPTYDSSILYQYHIGKLYYYPETKLSDYPDSLILQTNFKEFRRREMVMRYRRGLFNYRPLREHTYLREGQLYNEDNYFKSINTLGRIGAWQQVDAIPRIRDKDSLDIYFFLVPAVKQSFDVNLEGSLNTSDIGTGNLWGIATSLAYTNKNVWKRAIQSVTTFRTGVELNILSGNQDDKLLQTFLVSLGHTYIFPGLVQPFRNWRVLNRADNKRTLLNITGSYVERTDYYRLRSLITSWGYEWKKGNNVWLYKPINIELYGIDKLSKLDSLLNLNPFLRASFNEGKIVSQSISLIKNFTSKNDPAKSHYIRFGLEEAGGALGFIEELKDQIYRYVKLEGEYRQSIKYRGNKTELAYRAFAGIGYNYGTDPVIGTTLPFFKQFSAGGPYSMRAWGLRQLGLGSSILSDTSTSSYRDRFGDMQLEANIEYRFPIASIAGFQVSSALYADMGNVWSVKKIAADPESQFSFSNIYRDLAIGAGTGLRIDFGYFLIRLDFAYKVKDPARQYNNGWMDRFFAMKERRQNGVEVSNYAFQLGIGLPF